MKRVRDYQQGVYSGGRKYSEDVKTPLEERVNINYPFEGLNLRERRSQLSKGETPKCDNARISNGYIEPRPGVKLIDDSFDSTVLYIREFIKSDGTVYTVVITQKSLYYSLDLSSFTRVTFPYVDGDATIPDPGHPGDNTKVLGGSTSWGTELNVGDMFKLDADGTEVAIASIESDTALTLDSAYPTTGTGAAYTVDRRFSGTLDDIWWAITFPESGTDYFVFSQGIDPIMYWTGAGGTITIIDRTEAPAAKVGMVFADRIIIGNVANYPYRLKWTIVGAASTAGDWTGVGSGYQDTIEDPYDITGLSEISGIGLIYKTYSIMQMTRTGIADSPFDFKMRVPGIGCYLAGSLNSFGDSDVFMGSDNFYTYDLRAIKAIGDKIKETIVQSISPTYATRSHALVVEEYNEYQFYYPSTGSEYPNKCIVYNYDLDAWTSQWDRPAHSSGYSTQATTYSWDSYADEVTWDSMTSRWDDVALDSLYPMSMIGYGSALYQIDPTLTTDEDTSYFLFNWETKDVILKESKNQTLYRVIIAYQALASTMLYVAASTDGGYSWTDELAVSLRTSRPDKTEYTHIDFLVTGESHCVRIRDRWGGRFKILNVWMDIVETGEVIPEIAASEAPDYEYPIPPTPPSPPTEPPVPPAPPTPPSSVPSITLISPTSGVTGTYVTITGSNFGSTQGTSLVKFGALTATISSWSNTSIVAIAPSSATTSAVTVTTSGGVSNGVQFTVLGGVVGTWVDLGQKAGQMYIWNFCDLGSGIVLAGTGSYSGNGARILRSADYGANWSDLGQQVSGGIYLVGFAAAGSGRIFAGGTYIREGGDLSLKLLRSTNAGLTWTETYSLDDKYTSDLQYLGGNIIIFGQTPGGNVYRSTDNGDTWSVVTALNWYDKAIGDFGIVSGGLVFGGGTPLGELVKSTDYGASWTNKGRLFTQTHIQSLAYAGQDSYGNYVMLVGTADYNDTGETYTRRGKILRSTSTSLSTLGDIWSDVTPSNMFPTKDEGQVRCLLNIGSGRILAGTGSYGSPDGGYIWISTDYGATWANMGRLGSESYVLSLGLVSGTTSYALAGTYPNGHIYRLTI